MISDYKLKKAGYVSTEQLVDLWTEVAPVLKDETEAKLLNRQLENLLARFKRNGVKVPDVYLF